METSVRLTRRISKVKHLKNTKKGVLVADSNIARVIHFSHSIKNAENRKICTNFEIANSGTLLSNFNKELGNFLTNHSTTNGDGLKMVGCTLGKSGSLAGHQVSVSNRDLLSKNIGTVLSKKYARISNTMKLIHNPYVILQIK